MQSLDVARVCAIDRTAYSSRPLPERSSHAANSACRRTRLDFGRVPYATSRVSWCLKAHSVSPALDAITPLIGPDTRAAVTAERAVLSTLEAGCSAPLGALADVVEGEDGEELWLRAVALSEDGGLSVRMSATGLVTEAAQIGTRLASDMLDEGAADLMEAPVRKQHA